MADFAGMASKSQVNSSAHKGRLAAGLVAPRRPSAAWSQILCILGQRSQALPLVRVYVGSLRAAITRHRQGPRMESARSKCIPLRNGANQRERANVRGLYHSTPVYVGSRRFCVSLCEFICGCSQFTWVYDQFTWVYGQFAALCGGHVSPTGPQKAGTGPKTVQTQCAPARNSANRREHASVRGIHYSASVYVGSRRFCGSLCEFIWGCSQFTWVYDTFVVNPYQGG